MLNRAELIGRLTHAPELRYTSEGTPVCRIALATNVMVGSGESREERTEYHDVTAWGALAETCAQYLTRGRLVYVDGHLHTEKWERDAVPQRRTVVVASVVRFLDRPDGVAVPEATSSIARSDAER